jgi:hypothetical protein
VAPGEEQAARIARILERITATAQTSGDLIFENNAHYEIRWLIYSHEFRVSIKVPPFDEVKAEAEQSFLHMGFERNEQENDLCLIRLSFVADKEVAPDFSKEDAVPNGCPVPVVAPPQ